MGGEKEITTAASSEIIFISDLEEDSLLSNFYKVGDGLFSLPSTSPITLFLFLHIQAVLFSMR